MVSTRLMSIVSETLSEIYCHGSSDHVSMRATRSSATAHSLPSTSEHSNPPASKSNLNFLDLPPEIIEKILSYVTFKNVCQLRLVCRSMDRICGQVLNSTFQRLQTQMLNRFQSIKSKMPRRESARRNHHLACESDIIETLYMRLTLLQMSFGKHIERKHCCFFPGEILDEVFNILRYIKVTPKLARPYKVTDELFDLSTMAMEYFKEKIEPELPEIAYFGTDFLDLTSTFSSSGTNKYLALDSSPIGPEETKEIDQTSNDVLDIVDLGEPLPQSNMVLRKRIRKIKQGMKRYNSQLTLLRQDLRTCKRKTTEQQKQISEQQKQLAEQQKQTLEYATRLDEYDKKNEEISRKFSTLLQELNKCKTELQYWRSKSPATPPFCSGCGNSLPPPLEELQALMNQGVNPTSVDFDPVSEFIPIAGTSTYNEPVPEILEYSPKKEQVEKEVVPVVGKCSKRKLEEPKDTPISLSTSKKPRRVPKVRSKKVKL